MENVTDMKFKKKLIMFSEKEYNRALKVSREKLSYLMQAIEWASNHIEVDDAEVFANDMVGYFARRLAESKPELVKLGVTNPNKIAELLDINLTELSNLEDRFNVNDGRVKFNRGKVQEDVNPEDFKIYTKDEQQNKELEYAEKIIKVLLEAEEVTTINKRFISQVTGGLVYFNPYDGGQLKYNHQQF